MNSRTLATLSAKGLPRQSARHDLVPIPAREFDLGLTLDSGQVFHWQKAGPGYAGAIGERPVYVEQRGDSLLVRPGDEDLVRHYFALDHPLEDIYATFPTDPAMDAALAFCRGLRVIRQPLWECLATFITSALKQVPHIAQISHLLRRRFGRQVGEIGGLELFAYPAAAQIARLEVEHLRACALGFRARNVLLTARALTDGRRDLESIRALDRAGALHALREFPGVGAKVANCVSLFAYERLDAFPIDVWIERVLREAYFPRQRKVPVARLQQFSQDYFGPYGGYAQQYLFHHARKQKGRAKKPKKI